MDKILKFLCFAFLLTQVSASELTEQDQIYIVSGILGGVCLILTIISIVNIINLIGLQSELKKLQSSTKSSNVGVDNMGMAPLNEGTKRDSVEMHQKPGGGVSRDPYMAYDTRPSSGRPVSQGPSRESYVHGRFNSATPARDQHSRPAGRPASRAPSNAEYY